MLPGRFVVIGIGGGFCLILGGPGDLLVFFEGQVELVETFRPEPEPVPVLACNLVLKLLDQ